MATVDLYQICERYRDVLTEQDRRSRKAKKGIRTQGMFDLSGVTLKVIGEVEWKRLPVVQQEAQGYSFPQSLGDQHFGVSRIHEHYRKVHIHSGRVVGIYNPLKIDGPIGGEISIDPGCPSCDYQDQVEITVQGSCQYKSYCNYYFSTPQMTVTLEDVKQKYSFKCLVLCEGSVRMVIERGNDERDILEIVRAVKEPSLIRRYPDKTGKDMVCWEMTGEYTTNGNPSQKLEIE